MCRFLHISAASHHHRRRSCTAKIRNTSPHEQALFRLQTAPPQFRSITGSVWSELSGITPHGADCQYGSVLGCCTRSSFQLHDNPTGASNSEIRLIAANIRKRLDDFLSGNAGVKLSHYASPIALRSALRTKRLSWSIALGGPGNSNLKLLGEYIRHSL